MATMRILPAIGFVFAFGSMLAGCSSVGSGRQTSSGAIEVGSCHIGGCSSELCSDKEDAVSTCSFQPEFACYQSEEAVCEPQRDGECGWSQSRQLTECLTSGGP
jgi:hypothetical protein